MAFARVEGTVGSDSGDLLFRRDLVEQFGQHGCIAHVADGELGRADLQCFLVNSVWILRQTRRFVPPCFFVGKEVGAHGWPKARIDAAIVCAALAGKQVVRLKSGDPSIFGRASEEIAAARADGIAVDVVAGVTAASAAAAALCQPLRARGVTDRVVLATATCRPGETMSDLGDIARPGSTLVFHTPMHQLDRLAAQLAAAGVRPDQPVTVAAHVTRPDARSLQTTVQAMAADCARTALANPAIIVIRLPKRPGNADHAAAPLSQDAGAGGLS
jgi:uroporphyrin-III C-methyltransferase